VRLRCADVAGDPAHIIAASDIGHSSTALCSREDEIDRRIVPSQWHKPVVWPFASSYRWRLKRTANPVTQRPHQRVIEEAFEHGISIFRQA
jgi:hypothetical protein